MRTLVVATTVAASLLGGAVAVGWHYARFLDGYFGYFVDASTGEVHIDTGSLVLPVLVGALTGALAGLAAGLLLVRSGWRLVRT
jgi:hypothetical protein